MVAKASWLAVEPDISLAGYLASEEPQFSQSELSWMPEVWATSDEEFELHTGGDADVDYP